MRADELARRAASPDPVEVLLTALGPRPRLWERRRDDDDRLGVRLSRATGGDVQPGRGLLVLRGRPNRSRWPVPTEPA